jgi:hypothetical protein
MSVATAGLRSWQLHLARHPAMVAVRRSAGRWALPALIVVEMVNASARGQIWAVEWQWTAYWSNASTYLVCPLVAGVAAAESIRYRRCGAEGLVGLSVGRLRAHLLPGMAIGGWAVMAHAVGVGACALAAARLHHDLDLPVGPTLPAFAALVAWAMLGSAIGWLGPSLVTPPVVVIAGVVVLAFPAPPPLGWVQPLTRVETATGSLLGLSTRPVAAAAAVLWWMAVSLLALRLVARSDGRGVRLRVARALAWDGAVLAAVVVAALVASAYHGAGRFTGARTVRLVCSATSPPLCVNAEYESRLKVYAGPAVVLSRAIGRVEPSAQPPRLVQAGPTMAGTRAVDGTVTVAVFEQGPADVGKLAQDLVDAASGCAQPGSVMKTALRHEQDRLIAWLLATAQLPDGLPAVDDPLTSVAGARDALTGLRAGC